MSPISSTPWGRTPGAKATAEADVDRKKLSPKDASPGYTKSKLAKIAGKTKSAFKRILRRNDHPSMKLILNPDSDVRVDSKKLATPDSEFTKNESPNNKSDISGDYTDVRSSEFLEPEVDQVNLIFMPDTTESKPKSTAMDDVMQAKFTEDQGGQRLIYCSKSISTSEELGKLRGRIVDAVIEVPYLDSKQEPQVLAPEVSKIACPCDKVLRVLCPLCYTHNFYDIYTEDRDSDEAGSDGRYDEEDGFNDDETDSSTVDSEEEYESDDYLTESDLDDSFSDGDLNILCNKCNRDLDIGLMMQQRELLAQLNKSSVALQECDEHEQSLFSRDESDGNYSDSSMSENGENSEVSEYSEASEECSDSNDSEASEDASSRTASYNSENLECEPCSVEDGDKSEGLHEDDEEVELDEGEEEDCLDEVEAELDDNEESVVDFDEDEEDVEEYLEDEEDLDEDMDYEDWNIMCPTCYTELFNKKILATMGYIGVKDYFSTDYKLKLEVTENMDVGKATADAETMSPIAASVAPKDTGKAFREKAVYAKDATIEQCDDLKTKLDEQVVALDIENLIWKDNLLVREAEKLARKLFGDIVDFNVQFNFTAPDILRVFEPTSKTLKYDLKTSESVDSLGLEKAFDAKRKSTPTKRKLNAEKVDRIGLEKAFDDKKSTATKRELNAKGSVDEDSDSLQWDDDLEWERWFMDEDSWFSSATDSFCVLDEDDLVTDSTEETDGDSDIILKFHASAKCSSEEESTTQFEKRTDLGVEDEEFVAALTSKDEMFALKLDKMVRETYGKDALWEFEATHKLMDRENEETTTEGQNVATKATQDEKEERLDVGTDSALDNAEHAVEVDASDICVESDGLSKINAELVSTKISSSEGSPDSRMPSQGSGGLYTSENSQNSSEFSATKEHEKPDVTEDESQSFSTDDLDVEDRSEVSIEPSSADTSHDQMVEKFGDENASRPSSTWTLLVHLFTDLDVIDHHADIAEFDIEERVESDVRVNVVYSLRSLDDFQQIMYRMDSDIAENLPPLLRFELAAKALSQIVAPHRVYIGFQLPPDAPPQVHACYLDLCERLKHIKAQRFQPLVRVVDRIFDAGLPLGHRMNGIRRTRAHCKSAHATLERVGDYLEEVFDSKRSKRDNEMQRWHAKHSMSHALRDIGQVLEVAPLPAHVKSVLQRILVSAEETMDFLNAYPASGIEVLSYLRLQSLQMLECLAEEIPRRDVESARQHICMEYLNLVCDGLLHCVFFTPAKISVRYI